MHKEFIPYEQAGEMDALGYDEHSEISVDYGVGAGYRAILYQQAFRWFREYYNLDSFVQHHINGLNETYFSVTRETSWDVTSHNTYEEAEIACLKKLIEIVKNK